LLAKAFEPFKSRAKNPSGKFQRCLYDEEIFDLKEELGKHISSLHGSNADLEITTVMTSGILEIVILLAAKDGFMVEELSSQIKEKQTQKGGFKNGYYLVWATKK